MKSNLASFSLNSDGELLIEGQVIPFQGAAIDSRQIKEDEVFFALDGENTEGYRYLLQAFSLGASWAFVASKHLEEISEWLPEDLMKKVLWVESPLEVLQFLAHKKRDLFRDIPVVGITGSVGKTTTKDFLSYLLKDQFVLCTEGNLNNHIGLPMMLTRLNKNYEYGVLEMGASRPGDIKELCGWARPQIGILTPIGESHLLEMGSLEQIYETKLELAHSEGLRKIITVDDAVLIKKIESMGLEHVIVGFSPKAKYKIENINAGDGFGLFFNIGGKDIQIEGAQAFQAVNAGLAIAAMIELGFTFDDIPEKWSPNRSSGRFQKILLQENVLLIHDAYNSNPTSFEVSLDAFSKIERSGRKILVFSDMLELGQYSRDLHESLGKFISRSNVEMVLAYGGESAYAMETLKKENPKMQAKHFAFQEELISELLSTVGKDDQVLFKASRGMHLENSIQAIEQYLGRA